MLSNSVSIEFFFRLQFTIQVYVDCEFLIFTLKTYGDFRFREMTQTVEKRLIVLTVASEESSGILFQDHRGVLIVRCDVLVDLPM